MKRLASDKEECSLIRSYIVDRLFLAKNFMHCRFSRIRREANHVAHQMVKAGFNSANQFWVEEVPDRVVPGVEEDRNWMILVTLVKMINENLMWYKIFSLIIIYFKNYP